LIFTFTAFVNLEPVQRSSFAAVSQLMTFDLQLIMQKNIQQTFMKTFKYKL